MKQFSFPKKKRLVSNKQFRAVLARKLRFSDGFLTFFLAENDCGYPRLGISPGKSCGKAIVRNRLKRLLREAFRQNQKKIPAGFDYLLMISPQWREKDKSEDLKGTVKKLTFEHVETSFLTLVRAAADKLG